MDGLMQVQGFAAPSFCTYQPKLSTEHLDQTISHLVSMALFYGTPSGDCQHPVESLEPSYNPCEVQGSDVFLPTVNIPNLSDLVSDGPPITSERKATKKRSRPSPLTSPSPRSSPSHGPQHIDVKSLIEAKMNAEELSSPTEIRRIAEMDAIILDFLRGNAEDGQEENSPTLENSSEKSKENQNIDQKGQPLLWRFIFKLLEYSGSNPSLVMWVNQADGEFQIVQPKQVAFLWGLVKNNGGMNYEKLSRGLRYYYKTGILVPVRGRLLYKYGAKANIWNLMKKSQQSSVVQNQYSSPQPGSSEDMSGYLQIGLPDTNANHMATDQFKDVLDVIDSLEPSSSSSSSYDSSHDAFDDPHQSLMMFNESMDLH